MDLAEPPSPSSTQRADTESPLEERRRHLEGLGMPLAEIDYLLRTYNRRHSCFDDDADFLDIVRGLITTQDHAQMRVYDFKMIEIELQNKLQDKNKELEAQFEADRTTILLGLLANLSAETYKHAIRFFQSDAYHSRINFVVKVLPQLLNSPTPTPTHQHPTAEDPRTTQMPDSSKKRAPKSKAQPSNVKLRRSARIRRLQEDSKKPTPPPSRRKNKKGKRGKEGRQVRQRL